MIIITGALRLPPSRMEEARRHMRTLIETTRAEPGCLLYAWAEDVLEPGLIRMIEHWQDWSSFTAHDRSPHASAWKAALDGIGLLGREMWAHDGSNGRRL
jgi:quinol monooxygenase YgiN